MAVESSRGLARLVRSRWGFVAPVAVLAVAGVAGAWWWAEYEGDEKAATDYEVLAVWPAAEAAATPAAPSQTGGGGSGGPRLVDFAIGPDGTIWVSENGLDGVVRIPPGGQPELWAGGNGPGWRDGPAAEAKFWAPAGIVVSADGSVLVADYWNGCVRRLRPDVGIVETLVGVRGRCWGIRVGEKEEVGQAVASPSRIGLPEVALPIDGPVAEAVLTQVADIAETPYGLLIADFERLRLLTKDGGVRTVDGSAVPVPPPVYSAVAWDPVRGVAYATDIARGRIVRVRWDGDEPKAEPLPLRGEVLANPGSIAVSDDGRVAVADAHRHVIYELDPESGEVRVLLKRASDGTSDPLLSEPCGLNWQGGYLWYVSWSEGLSRIVRVRVGP